VPLYLAGYDIYRLIAGAERAVREFERDDAANSVHQARWLMDGINAERTHFLTFFFDACSDHLGRWTSQLVAESFGKSDNPVYLFPVTALGTSDLHSIAQSVYAQPHPWMIEWILSPALTPLGEFERIREAIYDGAYASACDVGIPSERTLLEKTEFSV
jgi:glucose-6-phosphate isomerase